MELKITVIKRVYFYLPSHTFPIIFNLFSTSTEFSNQKKATPLEKEKSTGDRLNKETLERIPSKQHSNNHRLTLSLSLSPTSIKTLSHSLYRNRYFATASLLVIDYSGIERGRASERLSVGRGARASAGGKSLRIFRLRAIRNGSIKDRERGAISRRRKE